MSNADTLDTMIANLGEALEIVIRIDRLTEASWAIATERDRVIIAEVMADDGKLMLSAILDAPDTVHAAAVHEALLSYNAMWQETGGVTMALGGAGGRVMQLFPMTLAGLDGERLAATIENFAAKAEIWADFIARGPSQTEPMPAPDDAGTWIRA